MDGVIPDVKPTVEELSPSAVNTGGPVDENGSNGRGNGPVTKGPTSNNNTIKTLSAHQAKALQQQSQISSSPSGGTVYINSATGTLMTNPSQTASSVRTSIVTTTSTVATSRQQLETMAKSAGLNIVHVTVPQSVIQSPSVIQSASGQIQLSKGNVILVSSSKAPSGVIQATSGALQAVQLLESQQQQLNSDESLSNDGADLSSTRGGGNSGTAKRREILTRRPSYRKILNDLGGAEISGDRGESTPTSESSQDGLEDDGSHIIIGGQSYPQSVVKVLNANTLGLSGTSGTEGATSLQTITMTNAGTGGTIVQYAHPDGQPFYVPGNHWSGSPVSGDLQAYTIRPMSSQSSNTPTVVIHGGSGGGGGHQHGHPPEEQTRKREIRLLKNREAARECRRKKKEYIKCLENRVAVLENQNKALIDELKSLKELYCQQKVE